MPERNYGKEELRYLKEVLASGRLSSLQGGKMTGRFEGAFARAHGARYGVAMNCAMSVLHASVITAGVGPGDEVICDPVCVFGALATIYQRGKPVFVDCQPRTFNMDPDLIEPKITKRTKALIVTHVGGMPAEMDRIMPIARKHGLMVIEDCAQAVLATYKGRAVGAWGDVGSFSFQASKQFSLGDGGMAITSKKRVAQNLLLHAGAPTFRSIAYDVHYNYRMNEQTAAIGLAQLPKVRRARREFIRTGRLWNAAIEDCPWLIAQPTPAGGEGTYYFWAATFEGARYGISRKRFKVALAKHRLPFNLGYTHCPAYRQPVMVKVFGKRAYPRGLCPNAEYMIPRMLLGGTNLSFGRAERIAERLQEVIAELS